jgi:hypothetical protein
VLFFEELFEPEVMRLVTLEDKTCSTEPDCLTLLSKVSAVVEYFLGGTEDEGNEESEDPSDLVVFEESCVVCSEEGETSEVDNSRFVLWSADDDDVEDEIVVCKRDDECRTGEEACNDITGVLEETRDFWRYVSFVNALPANKCGDIATET